MVIAKQGMHPPGLGYFFEEIDKSAHKARSWLELERKVVKYRKINKFPLGEPLREIMEQAQRRWPDGFWTKTVRGE